MINGIAGKYIISGGPGAGKTTLIEGLKALGYECSAEVSRRLIIQEVERDSNCLPWKDIACFSDKVLEEMVISWYTSVAPLSFFDRGIPDIIAYLKIAELPVPDKFMSALEQAPYSRRVFILPPWADIYVNDNERWQSFEEAAAIYEAIKATYAELGFVIVELPKVSLEALLTFIIDFLNNN